MTGAHTPGPWTVFNTHLGVGVRATSDVAHCGGFDTDRSRDEEVANARLIAAAPTMFDYIAARAAAGDPEATQIMENLKATTPNAGERG